MTNCINHLKRVYGQMCRNYWSGLGSLILKTVRLLEPHSFIARRNPVWGTRSVGRLWDKLDMTVYFSTFCGAVIQNMFLFLYQTNLSALWVSVCINQTSKNEFICGGRYFRKHYSVMWSACHLFDKCCNWTTSFNQILHSMGPSDDTILASW